MSSRRPVVAIDDQAFVLLTRGGIARYFVELVRALSANDFGVEVVLPWRWTVNKFAASAGFGQRVPPVIGRRRVLHAANKMYRRQAQAADVVHNTFYAPEWFSEIAAARVITIHDMTPETLPEWFPSGNPHEDKQRYIAAADMVLCVSESTRSDLVRHCGSIRAEVVVTPLGVDNRFQPGLRPVRDLPYRYLLYVGDRAGYKDFATLVLAIAKTPSDLVLVAVGGGAFSRPELDLLREQGVGRRCIQLDLDEELLASAYSNASATVVTSRYEGFGLPALEAMASGCPVILANTSALPEVAAEAGWYFPVGDAGALSDTILRVISDRDETSKRVRIGRSRAAMYNWRRTAELTAAAYVRSTRV